MTQRNAVGVDLGGTLVRAGIVTNTGAVLSQQQASIAAIDPEQGMNIVEGLIDQVLAEPRRSSVTGIGVGATGPVDIRRGTINNPYTLQGWSDVPIVERLEQRFGLPVRLENDANAAALGEYWLGAGREARRLYAVTVGTGVGTSFVLDGVVQRGTDGAHTEGGHQLIDANGPECYCGFRGCWESLIAGPSIARRARAAAEVGGWRPSVGDRGDRFEARRLAEAARAGDEFAAGVMREVGRDLGRGLINIILLFLPEVLVLGGGVLASADLLMPIVQATIKSAQPVVPFESVRIEPAQLGDRAGLFGSAYLILKETA